MYTLNVNHYFNHQDKYGLVALFGLATGFLSFTCAAS